MQRVASYSQTVHTRSYIVSGFSSCKQPLRNEADLPVSVELLYYSRWKTETLNYRRIETDFSLCTKKTCTILHLAL